MKPTVGRIVHWFPDGAPEGQAGIYGDQPYAAIITHVHDDDCVNLLPFVKDHGQAQRNFCVPQTSVCRRGTPQATTHSWDWPPRV